MVECKKEWVFHSRPGYFGKRKADIFADFDVKFGKGNWRLVWEWGTQTLEWLMAVQLYEDAYYQYLSENDDALRVLISVAHDVFDNNPSNVNSKLDYTIQETPSTHLQDIAVRRCIVRLGFKFQGTTLVQIRHNAPTLIGLNLSPGRVPFHLSKYIKLPQLTGWWLKNTVEAFYQSNKIIQVKETML